MSNDLADDHEALIQFFYLVPVGLVQAAADGEILMINPTCAQLLVPLSPDGTPTNLFAALEHVAPDLRDTVARFASPSGMVCDALHIALDAVGARGPGTLSLTVFKLDDARLMAVLSDVTRTVQRERLLAHSQARLDALLAPGAAAVAA